MIHMMLAAGDSNVADLLSLLDRWSLLVGAVLPGLIAVINRHAWPGWLKLTVSVVACVAAAAVTAYLQGALNPHDLAGSVISVLTAAWATYHWAWKPSGAAPAIERATG